MVRTEPGDNDGEGACTTSTQTNEPMANLRPEQPAAAPLARARVFGALFGDNSVAAFGRFRVLDRLGVGGMGVVYEAYDRDLARGVALKLVKFAARAREDALAEAKALARLSHPNVVPIYDVGVERDHVYLVMELVRGQTLRDWPPGRTAREILGVYRQAGLALAAAHDVGLVHRDFKPDNAIVGADGRVRVVDFGLACEADDPARARREQPAMAGTPGFIAPEIGLGMAITPAADQYSFCVALARALELASGPVPRRLGAVLARGRAADAAARFPSMNDLLHAIARDPVRTWRRAGAVAGLAAAIAVTAFAVGRQGPNEPDPCGGGDLGATWSPPARSTALAQVAPMGRYGDALRGRLARDLGAYDRRWTQAYRAACLDRRRHLDSDTLVDRRSTCLGRASDAFAAVGDLISHAGPGNLDELPRAVQSMPDPASCSDRDMLAADIEPPRPEIAARVAQLTRRLAHLRIQIGAGRDAQAFAHAGAVVADARDLGYVPVLAEALLVQGQARTKLDRRSEAVPILTEAVRAALSSHADALAVEAWARRAYAAGTTTKTNRPAASLEMDVIEGLAQRTTSARFALALLYNNLGTAALADGKRSEARDQFGRALAVSQQLGPSMPLELVVTRVNLALTTDDRARSDELLDGAIAELTARLGADHPDTLMIRQMQGGMTAHAGEAIDRLTPVCQAQFDAARADLAAECWTEVGLLALERGDREHALHALQRALRAPREPAEASAYVVWLRGDARAAARQFARAIAAQPAAPGDHWWDRLARVRLRLGLGRTRRATGDVQGARRALEGAIQELEPIVRDHPTADYERRLGRARVELALTWSPTDALSPEQRRVRAAAATWLESIAGSPAEIAELRRGARDR